MQAISVKPLPADHADAFSLVQVDDPVAAANELLVRVHAVSVNPIDTKMRLAPVRDGSPERILGWDAAGIVVDAGAQTTRFKAGDRVFYAGSVRRSGTNAQLHCVDERLVGRMPTTLGFADAAALPLTTLTAWEALFEHMHVGGTEFGGADDIPRKRSLLIIGGAGGVGSVAIQLASQVPDLTVIATASRPESANWCRELGADAVIDHSGDFADQLKAEGLSGPDYVLMNTAPNRYFDSIADVLAPFGQICSIVDSTEPLDPMKLRSKAGAFVWQGMFVRSNLQTTDMAKQGRILDVASQWVDQGRLRSTRTTEFGPLTAANLAAAHQAIESGRTIGKAVLHWPQD
ncbi:MAG: zinc-binding alcohol dehydrogenase family protein [Burkholderiaceae bacterium]